ncbi:MAG: CHASE2 domain-containing protein, partial [Burkholderiales bacterium]|nr:CHASE2 domain-containing protein [Burkholderiales bacterium]
MRRHVNKMVRWLACLTLTFVAVLQANAILPVTLVDRVDNFIYDMRMRVQPTKLNNAIVIVNIDEKSLKEYGQWPWKRSVIAHMVERLTDDYHVRAVGVDAVFPEPDGSSGLQVLEDLAKKELKGDQDFVNQMDSLRTQLDFDDRL